MHSNADSTQNADLTAKPLVSAGHSDSDWQLQVDAIWNDESLSDEARISAIRTLADELSPSDPRGAFELGGAHDSAGHEAQAAILYEQAIALGLSGKARDELNIQYASTLRNLGRFDEAVTTLGAAPETAEIESEHQAFLALALHSAGRTGEALAVALEALIPHLGRYQRSLTGYAAELRGEPTSDS